MKVRLGDVCNIQSGGTPSRSKEAYWREGNIHWVKISDMKDQYIYDTEECITTLGVQNSSAKIFPKDTILYSIFATIGEVSILKIEAATNQAIAGIQIIDNRIYANYLYYYLLSMKFKMNNIGRGVAQNNINISILKNIEIHIRSLDEQKRIVMILDKVNQLIAKRHKQLEKLDELVKAKFVEMFGTLLNPSSSFKYDFLKNLCKKITDGKHGGCTKQDGSGYYFIGARDIFDDKVHYEHALEINIDEFKKDYKRCNVEIGDFLIVNTGATIGKSAIACDLRTTRNYYKKV